MMLLILIKLWIFLTPLPLCHIKKAILPAPTFKVSPKYINYECSLIDRNNCKINPAARNGFNNSWLAQFEKSRKILRNSAANTLCLFTMISMAPPYNSHVRLFECYYIISTFSSKHWNINVTHHCHFTCVYLFGITRPLKTRERLENCLCVL